MASNKDYSKMTLDELVLEEKKLKSQRIITALVIGFFVGVAIWSATHKGSFILTIGLLGFALFVGSKHSKNLKGVQAEINGRNTVSLMRPKMGFALWPLCVG